MLEIIIIMSFYIDSNLFIKGLITLIAWNNQGMRIFCVQCELVFKQWKVRKILVISMLGILKQVSMYSIPIHGHRFITSSILMTYVDVLTCDPTVFLFERPPFGACLSGWVVAEPARDFFSLGSTFSSNSSATSSNYKHRYQFIVTVTTFN